MPMAIRVSPLLILRFQYTSSAVFNVMDSVNDISIEIVNDNGR